MRNYIILNNQNSNTISGLIIQELAPISKPLQRTQVETIDGRDGDIVTPLGYAAYDKKITIGLYGDFDINEIIAYFATQGTAIFSNEPDKYYNYQILDQIDYERLVRFRVATVTMHVQPFKYSATEGTITVDTSDTVSGEGSDIALDGTAEAPFNVLRHKGNATQTTYAGKNLCPYMELGWLYGTDGSERANTSAVQTIRSGFIAVEPNTTYIVSSPDYSGTWFWYEYKSDKTYNLTTNKGNATGIFTTETGTQWVRIRTNTPYADLSARMQVELGSTATVYEPYVGGIPSPNPDYPQDIKLLTGDSTIAIDDGGDNSQEYVIPFGDTYLAGIGNYADEPVKVGDTWYIRRKIGKVVLDGNETWTNYGNAGGLYTAITAIGATSTADISPVMSDNFTAISYNDGYYGNQKYGVAINPAGVRLAFIYDGITTGAAWKSWLSAHNTTVYYALATPTDEEITDQDLIDALDEFYGQAHSYKGHTHITATAADGNAPAVLSVEVGEDNESTVTNAGNTTSRPILTIYGQGDIGVYINDVEVLDIALGNEQYITLDSTEMDAYKDSPANLKNRLVTGDYSKLALNAGANKIRFTGIVTKYEISKYSRWL